MVNSGAAIDFTEMMSKAVAPLLVEMKRLQKEVIIGTHIDLLHRFKYDNMSYSYFFLLKIRLNGIN